MITVGPASNEKPFFLNTLALPPKSFCFSTKVTSWPFALNLRAADIPPKPEPIKPTVKKPNGISLEPKKPISEVKTESSGFKLSKDLMIGLLGGVVLYLVVLK